jgi:putative transposase
MGRSLRAAEGGLVYHALNRANARLVIFAEDGDYEAFEAILAEAVQRYEMRLLSYCLMPTHFHLVLWPVADGDLSRFMRWLTLTHTQRWHAFHRTTGSGHLYQGRFKSFPIQSDEHLWTVCRYVERNPLCAELVPRAEKWRWGSLWQQGRSKPRTPMPPLSPWPIARPADWVKRVNAKVAPAEEEPLRRAIDRNQPFGAPEWQASIAKRLGLESTMRPIGRPRKDPKSST